MKVTMGRSFGGALVLAAASVLVVSSFVGCAKPEEKGTFEKAGAAADKAIGKVKDASAEAAKSVSEAAEKAKDAAAAAAKDAAAGAAKAASTAVAPKKK